MNAEITNKAIIMCDEMYGRAVIVLATILQLLEKEEYMGKSVEKIMQVN